MILLIYLWNILAGSLLGGFLSVLGPHLACRDQAMQLLCAGQGALLGVILGMGLDKAIGKEHTWPFPLGLAIALLVFLLTQRMVKNKTQSRNTYFAFLFCLLNAISFCVSSLLPQLETHMTQIYFGDLTTLVTSECIEVIVLTLLASCFLGMRFKSFLNQSFEVAIFGRQASHASDPLFQGLILTTLSVAIQHVGYLFTMGCLFIPTAILSYSKIPGYRGHFILCFVGTVISVLLGFYLSIMLPRVPTVPSILILQSAIFLLFTVVHRKPISVTSR